MLWLHGPHGVVRFAPHDAADRLTPAQRWGALASEKSGQQFEDALATTQGADGSQHDDREDESHDEL